jgi:23S rRNA (adenine2503-C2)-methyltransferase
VSAPGHGDAGADPIAPSAPSTERPTPPAALSGLTDEELEALVVRHGGKPFQARQIGHWLFHHGASGFEGFKNLPRALRDALAQAGVTPRASRVVTSSPASDGTEKLLVGLADGEAVECVIIPDGERTTLCVSTQVGCPVACVFCASGLEGVRRNLTSAEIVDQVLHARDRLGEGRKLTNLVVMGMGEPLLNLRALLPALERIHDPDGINLGARRITVSTSGYPERIRTLAESPLSFHLAVSLHAANDTLRKKLVPTAKWPVREIVAAARAFFESRNREVTFEVVLLGGENDRPQDADALIHALQGFPCTVNLIPWNPVDRIEGLRRPADADVDAFADRLRAGGLNVTVRRQRGADQDAACGQLRLRHAGTGAE